MVVSQQLRLESCSPLFCGPASISHHRLVYKTPRRGLTFQKGPGGEEQDGLHDALQAATASPRETSFPRQCQPCSHPHVLTRPAQPRRQTGSTHRQHPATPACPGHASPADARAACRHRCGGRVGTPARARGMCRRAPTTRRALWTQMPRKTTPAGRQLRLGLEKQPKASKEKQNSEVHECLGGKKRKKKTPSYTQR